MYVMKSVLTIAGSDCSGGAGIQADLKTMIMNGVYGMSAITALTAQNTTGVRSVVEVSPEFLAEQIDMIFEDIRPDAVKIGMISSVELIKVIEKKIIEYNMENVVIDPVMVATSGARLASEETIRLLKSKLLSLATIVTPNISEAEILSEIQIMDEQSMEKAGDILCEKYGVSFLIKGGHSTDNANDLLCYEGKKYWIIGEKIDNPNTHGTGCTLSSAIAANLAKGYNVEEAVRHAKDYITGALACKLNLGKGSGPINHGYLL